MRVPGTQTCPVNALKNLFHYPQQPPELPLFCQEDGSPLLHGQFIAWVRLALAKAGYDLSKFVGHSFHTGAALSAVAAGFNDHEIQLLGRWCSDSYKL